VIDDGLRVGSVPAVDLNAAASVAQTADVGLDRGLRSELISEEIPATGSFRVRLNENGWVKVSEVIGRDMKRRNTDRQIDRQTDR
jgi:hypothetical protein